MPQFPIPTLMVSPSPPCPPRGDPFPFISHSPQCSHAVTPCLQLLPFLPISLVALLLCLSTSDSMLMRPPLNYPHAHPPPDPHPAFPILPLAEPMSPPLPVTINLHPPRRPSPRCSWSTLMPTHSHTSETSLRRPGSMLPPCH